MKSLLAFLIFSVTVAEISEAKLNITVFYETLCPASKEFFRGQFAPTFNDVKLRSVTHVELVPFGFAEYSEKPWRITCQHGPNECYGNAMNACFMARHPENFKQVAFISCCMSDSYPPHAGMKCAKKLGYSFKGVKKCAVGKEGIALQIKNGRRTLDFEPEIEYAPTIVYDNVYNDKDNDDSLDDFRAVIIRKLKAKGIKL